MKLAYSILIIFMMLFCAFAQEEKGWHKEVVGNLNFTQNQFDNWTAGGENSWSWQMDINTQFNYIHENYKWENSGKLSFGKTKLSDQQSRKSADEIKLESVYIYKFNPYVNPFVSATALTQIAPGYDYPADAARIEISNFLDPAYFTQSVGVDYEPNKMVKTRLGAALKETLTDKHPVPYADDPETTSIEKTKIEYGAESVTNFQAMLNDQIKFTSKLNLFSNFESVDAIDVDWDNMFSAKVAEYIAVSLNIRLFYDKDLSLKRQLKEVLAVGLTYSLY